MSGDRWATVLVLLLICPATLVIGCGGNVEGTTEAGHTERGGDVAPRTQADAIAQANENCKELLRDVRRIGRRARTAAFGTSLVTVTESLAKPAISVVKQVGKRQRALEHAIDDPHFDLYVELFDPIIVLAEERVRAGLAEHQNRSERLQYLLTNLSDEQRLAARQANLPNCEVDFFAAMVRAYGS